MGTNGFKHKDFLNAEKEVQNLFTLYYMGRQPLPIGTDNLP